MFKKILIANRGEVAVRLVRAVTDLGIRCVAIFASDDANAQHVRIAAEAVALAHAGQATAIGPSAYLDVQRILAIAEATSCDAIHPGYGFLSERAEFARQCEDAGICFIGPTPQQLAVFGDKAQARALALQHHVPLMPGSQHAVTLEETLAFFVDQQSHGSAGVMIKAIGGGGGRGMRAVLRAEDLSEAYARCRSEARAAFDVDGVYVERLMVQARHIEIQVVGDGQDVMALGDRECSLQRRFQKLVEIAPSPVLPEPIRRQLTQAALRLAAAVGYRSLGTFEFLVDAASPDVPFVFIEANPRLQVEHTVTEAVTGLDLVQLQIAVAAGRSLRELGLDPAAPPSPRGYAIQWRINAETLDAQGQARPSSGALDAFDMPSGPGIRVDTHGFRGYTPSPHYDTLLAKLIVHSTGSFADAARRARRALAECRIDGIATNLPLLRALAAMPQFDTLSVHTRFVEAHLPALLEQAARFAAPVAVPAAKAASATSATAPGGSETPDDAGQFSVRAPMPARLVQMNVAVGQLVPEGHQIAVLEAMKMEHLLLAQAPGRVLQIHVCAGDYVGEGQALALLTEVDATTAVAVAKKALDPDHIRPDLQRVIDRHAFTLDANRPSAVAKRHARGGRTARENVADLCDLELQGIPGRFIEYGALTVAAQTRRRSMQELITNTPADGMVTGLGTVNVQKFGAEKSRCAIFAYDYMVLAGTQGMRNHQKMDRVLALAHELRLPVVLFAEGGGGRPGDTDMPIVAALNNHTFSRFAALSGKVPVVGIVHGRCYAGNAALLGCADVIIATRDSNIGMGGPAMIEGGGLGRYAPENIGPSAVQSANGVIDVLVEDEAQAVQAARHYLSFFQGDLSNWTSPDQRLLRHAVPENRLRVYDMRAVMGGLVDEGSLLELRAGFGVGILTALARIDGKAIGILANNPRHLGGAIDRDAADKAARFMQLCDAHGLPIVSLVDTPGFMVGPEIEAQAQVRHVCRMFVVESHLRVPFFAVVLRKGYGLGAQAMTAGGFDAPVFTVSWPTGEFGGMGLEGAVRLGYRRELEAVPEGTQRDALFKTLVEEQYRNGEAINVATALEIDAVIDPAQTRAWLTDGLAAAANRIASATASAGTRFIDTW
jgi:acetyl/propionyl-CoA carboxylase alpha subunit